VPDLHANDGSSLKSLFLHYLNGLDVQALAMTDGEIMAAVEAGLLAQGRGETVIEPRVHLIPDPAFNGHFNVLRGYVAPLGLAGVKIVGDYVDNYKQDLPSEMALLNLFDPRSGMPLAVIDASAITDMRTGAMTALGAKHLASANSKILGHIGAPARAAPRTGTFACLIASLTSTRFGCTPGARKAA